MGNSCSAAPEAGDDQNAQKSVAVAKEEVAKEEVHEKKDLDLCLIGSCLPPWLSSG